MPYASWPSTVNAYAIRGTYTEEPERYVFSFTPEHGDPIESPATSRITAKIGYDGRYTAAEWDALLAFYRDTLAQGVLPFALKNPETGRLGIYKFTAAPIKREVKMQKRRASIALRQLTDVESETQSLLDAMAVAPDVDTWLSINNVVYGLKRKGLWAKAAGLWFLAAHDAQAARLNWKTRALLTVQGTCTFTANGGYAGDGSSGYLDTGADVATFFAQDNAALFVHATANSQQGATAADAGSLSSANVRVNARSTSNTLIARANYGADVTVSAVTEARELAGWSRTAANAYAIYSGTAATARTDTSAAIAGNLVFLRSSAAYSTRRLGFAGAFAALTATDVANLRTIVRTRLIQAGAI